MTRDRLGLSAALYVFVACAYFMPGASWSPATRYALTRAIVEHRTFEITRYADSTGDRARVGDRFYSEKAPLPSLLAVPAYAAFHAVSKIRGRFPAYRAEGTSERPARRVIVSPAYRNGLWICSISTSGLAAAALVWMLYRLLTSRVSNHSALLAAVSAAIATPIFPYATSFFGHTLAAAFLLAGYTSAYPHSMERKPRYGLTGFFFGCAIGSEYLAAVVVAAFVAGALYFTRERRSVVALRLAAGAIVPSLVIGYYHLVCFGAPWATGYAFIGHPEFVGQGRGFLGITWPRADALWGLTFGSSRGLFFVSPLCAVAIWAGAKAYRATRDQALALGGIAFGLLFVVNASYFQWDGGWALGPRHLVPALPLFGIAIGYAFEDVRLRSLAAASAGVSAAIVVLATAIGLEVPPNRNVVFDYLIPEMKAGRVARISGASNLGLLLGLGPRGSIFAIVAWLGAGGAFLGWKASSIAHGREPAAP